MLRHWPSAWTWLSTVLMVCSVAPFRRHQLMLHRQKPFRRRCAAATPASDDGCRRPGRPPNCRSGSWQARRARCAPRQRHPRRSGTAAARSPDRPRLQAICEFAPGSPWNAIFLRCSFLLFGHLFQSECRSRQASRPVSTARALSKSSGVSTPSGTASTIATSMRMPASSARNCSSFSRRSSGDGGKRDETLQRRAAIGIKPDVVIERPVARRRRGAGEIERPQPRRRDRRADDLDHIGIGALVARL